ncbi:Retrovirus-related Pol polyprotein from transposon RE1 [Vitis vinifera]|uniref:Retrovirus-related Pol polyprotein from transposon RE1 n=1 Tax=Vitis vinifera TaxID=29760 RepID=A0A438C3L5_VITVI|nr:Retrovirus-related Pol polyprotein from transposon RE1 [Vitis vinifera]
MTTKSYEDHLTQEADIPEVDRIQWRKIDAQLYLETARDQPLYFLPPRVFCCTCFVHILTLWIGQTFCQSHKMHLLGILQTSKGLSFIATFSPLMSPYLRTHHSSPPLSLFLFLKLPLPIISPLDAVRSRPLQVYHRHHRVAVPPSLVEVPVDSLPIPSASPAPVLPPSADLPYCFSERAPLRLFPIQAALQTMVDEMAALHSNDTWDFVVLPSGKSTVGCRWVYTVKIGPNGQVDRLKARLVAKGYTSVYMEQPPGFVAQGESGLVCRLRRSLYDLKQSPRAWFSRFSSVVQEFSMFHSTADHSVFYHHNSSGQCIYLVVYVTTSSLQAVIRMTFRNKATPFHPLSIKDLGKLKYFLGIEITQSVPVWFFPKGRQGEPLEDPGDIGDL